MVMHLSWLSAGLTEYMRTVLMPSSWKSTMSLAQSVGSESGSLVPSKPEEPPGW